MCQLIEVTWFIWKLSADQLIILLDRYQCSVSYFLASLGSEHRKTDTRQCCGSSLIFLKFISNMLCLCAAQLKFWFQTDLGRENSASCYRQGRQLLLTFLAMFTRWSRSTSNFYALIGQNLTGEFMRKIYAASWILFTLTAEVDGVLCQLVMFLTFFSHWMYKMKFSCYQESSVIHG